MRHWIACLALCLLCVSALGADPPRARIAQTEFDFGRAPSHTPIQHEFRISNASAEPLRIERVALTPPLRLAGMRAQIAPGADATLKVTLDPAKLSGRFDGYIVVYTNDPGAPEITLSFSGEVILPIELSPRPEFFLAGSRDRSAVATMDIINHQSQPLELAPPQHAPTHLTSRLETVEPGQRYRLSIALNP